MLLFAVAGACCARAQVVDDTQMFARSLRNPDFASAWDSYEQGDYAAAYDAFGQLFRQYPGDAQVNMAYALAAKKAGRFSHAALALDRVLMEQPGNRRAELELAETYYFMKQYELAEEKFERVLAVDPPEVVRDNIMSYMKMIQQRTSRFRLSGRVEAGMFHDDNINVGPSDAVISIDPIRTGSIWIDTLTVNPESRPQEAWGAYGALQLNGWYDTGLKGGWQLLGSLSVYQSVLDDHNEYEMGYYRASGGLQYEQKHSLLRVPVKAERVIRGHETLADVLGLTPTWIYAVREDVHLVTAGSVEYRDYDTSSAYTGWYYGMGETVRWFWNRRRGSVGLGVRAVRESAREDVYSSWGGEGSLTADYRVLRDTTVFGLGQWKRMKYDGRPPFAAEDREDDQFILSCGVQQRVVPDWAVTLNYRYTHNDSNFDLYSYRRHVFMLNTAYSF